MKKALVMTFVLVLGLGLAAFADGALSGVWDTDVSLYPAASDFSDFIKSFTSGVDVDYTIGGFTFGMDSTFGLLGLTGMEFDVDGTLGAFTLSAEIDFAPRIVTAETITYTGLQTASSCCDPLTTPCWTWTKKTVKQTVTAGFDDLKAEVSVSIAGVSLGSVFFLEGVDNEATNTISYAYEATQTPSNTYTPVVTDETITIEDPTKSGSGWKFSASGSFNGATLTGLAYFNLKESNAYGYYTLPVLSDKFVKRGNYSLVCDDCIVRFTSAELILEDVSFACTTFKALVAFDCCGFSSVMFLLEDIGFGCCWDLGFDLLITFTDTAKTLTLKPEITLANACFTIDAAIVADTAVDDFELQGIDIYAISLEYSWNGITFSSVTSFDIANHAILGDYGEGWIYGPELIWVWQPDTDMTEVAFSYAEETDTCTATLTKFAIDTSAVGYYELTSKYCEHARVWEKFAIKVDGDACCGGDFEISAAFYMGDVYYLSDLDGFYWYDADVLGGGYAATEYVYFYGSGDTPVLKPTATGPSAGCNCCPCDDDCSFTVDAVDWDSTWTGTTNRLFDWVKTDVDVVFAITSAFDLTAGFDITCWGWEDFTFGFGFTF